MSAALAEIEVPTTTPTRTDLSGAVFAARRGRAAGRQWQAHDYDAGKGWAMHSVVDGEEHWTHRKTDELLDAKRWRIVPVEQVDLELLNSGTGFQMPRIAAPRRRITGRPKRKRDELVAKRIDQQAKALLEVFEAAKHPTRLRVLLYGTLCGREKFSPVEVCTDLGLGLGVVSYHFRTLKKLKMLKEVSTTQRRGAIEHHFALTPKGQTIVQLVEGVRG